MKKNIAIAMGGYSQEHAISIESGNTVYKNISIEKYNPYRIIFDEKHWYWLTDNDEKIELNKSDFTIKHNGELIKFDAVFNTIHGAPGENGLLQAHLDLIGLPHTSCDFYQSAITFNKRDCISVLKPYNIPVAENIFLNKGDVVDSNFIVNKVGLPCFVKANRSGSSLGVYKVYELKDINLSIQKVFEFDDEIIIESFLDGMEVSVGVGLYKNKSIIFGTTEIISENDFFDFQAKYKGKSKEITPARLTLDKNNEVETLAHKIYNVLNLKGFVRIDFIFHNNKPNFIEINTNPGLSKESILPQQALNKQISLSSLFSNEIEQCLKRNPIARKCFPCEIVN